MASGNLLLAGVLHAGPDDAGRERAAEADAREMGHEAAACFVEIRHAA
jgi:hypothetical protein